jgi:hypothetical protein
MEKARYVGKEKVLKCFLDRKTLDLSPERTK